MRIDGSPSLADIRSSIIDGTVVIFFNQCEDQVRGKVLDARLDPGLGGLLWRRGGEYGAYLVCLLPLWLGALRVGRHSDMEPQAQ